MVQTNPMKIATFINLQTVDTINSLGFKQRASSEMKLFSPGDLLSSFSYH